MSRSTLLTFSGMLNIQRQLPWIHSIMPVMSLEDVVVLRISCSKVGCIPYLRIVWKDLQAENETIQIREIQLSNVDTTELSLQVILLDNQAIQWDIHIEVPSDVPGLIWQSNKIRLHLCKYLLLAVLIVQQNYCSSRTQHKKSLYIEQR